MSSERVKSALESCFSSGLVLGNTSLGETFVKGKLPLSVWIQTYSLVVFGSSLTSSGAIWANLVHNLWSALVIC